MVRPGTAVTAGSTDSTGQQIRANLAAQATAPAVLPPPPSTIRSARVRQQRAMPHSDVR